MNRIAHEYNAVIAIIHRDIIISLKSPARIGFALMMPVMMLGMFGSQLSQNMGIYMNFDFNTFMVVGMIVNGLFMTTTMGMSNLVEDRETDFTQELFVSPVSRFSIILGKIIGSSLVSYLQVIATIVIGFLMGARLSPRDYLVLLALSPLMCLAAGSFAVLCIGAIRKPTTASFLMMMTSMAQMFLSGALIPVNHSTGVMAVVSRLLPMTYCVDFARGVFYTGVAEGMSTTLHSPLFNFVIILIFTAVFFTTGTAAFVRAEKNR